MKPTRDELIEHIEDLCRFIEGEMHLKAKKPIFVPEQFHAEMEKFSKAAIMDIAWDLATRCSGGDDLNGPRIMEEFRDTAKIVTAYRNKK